MQMSPCISLVPGPSLPIHHPGALIHQWQRGTGGCGSHTGTWPPHAGTLSLGVPSHCHLHVRVMAPVLMADLLPASPTGAAAGTVTYPGTPGLLFSLSDSINVTLSHQ